MDFYIDQPKDWRQLIASLSVSFEHDQWIWYPLWIYDNGRGTVLDHIYGMPGYSEILLFSANCIRAAPVSGPSEEVVYDGIPNVCIWCRLVVYQYKTLWTCCVIHIAYICCDGTHALHLLMMNDIYVSL